MGDEFRQSCCALVGGEIVEVRKALFLYFGQCAIALRQTDLAWLALAVSAETLNLNL